MRYVHRYSAGRPHLRGPGATRGWPTNNSLDPILTDYQRVRPWNGCITNDGIQYRYLSTDPQLARSIADVRICDYQEERNGRPMRPEIALVATNPKAPADDAAHVYAFEGATGSVDGGPPAWSLMGLVVEQPVGREDYDVHIVFRGSQSGSAYRAAYEGFVGEHGNPDWVTDMEFLKSVEDWRFSPEGAVVLGLRDSVLSSLSSLATCLQDIAERNGRAPRAIRITGHSLGGGLATLLASALSVGTVRSNLPEELSEWPWDDIALITLGAPKGGDAAFARHLDSHVNARRVWAVGDPITEFPLNEHVGQPVPLHTGITGTPNHEPVVMRRSMVSRIRWLSSGETGNQFSHLPWRSFADLGSALHAAEQEGESLDVVLGPELASHTDELVQIARRVVATASSYRIPYTKPKAELRRRERRLGAVFGYRCSTVAELAKHLRRIRGVQPGSSVEGHLQRMYAIQSAVRAGWTSSNLLDDPAIARVLGTYRRPALSADDAHRTVAAASGPPPNRSDIARVNAVLWMRRQHRATVNDSTESSFRRRVPPVSGMPNLVPACQHYPGLEWLPRQLMVPEKLPPEAQLQTGYKAFYYGLGRMGFSALQRSPIRPEVPWSPDFEWNSAFAVSDDGWTSPTSDQTYVKLRTQGPNPFLLRASDDGFEVDFSKLFDGVLPPIRARFDLVDGTLQPRDITVGAFTHRPGDPTWDRAKRVVNAADIRCVPFLRHLLDVHFIVGQAFALSAYRLPTWHPLRPFVHFFSYGTMQVNDFAYRSFFTASSYFVSSGFITDDAAQALFHNRIEDFDLDEWIPPKDIERRGLNAIPDHPYVADSMVAWTELEAIVARYVDKLELDDETIAADHDLQGWYLTLASLIPNLDPRTAPLTRNRLVELCAAFLYNNVVHEVCGDMSPILSSAEPDDRAIINLEKFSAAVGDGELTTPLPAPSMSDVFLMDQASYTSSFNVGGNKLLSLTAARWIDDPKLVEVVEDLQSSLRLIEADLLDRNRERDVRFSRMLPSTWEASISF